MADIGSFPTELQDRLDRVRAGKKENPQAVYVRLAVDAVTYYLEQKRPLPANIRSLVTQAMLGKTDRTTQFAITEIFDMDRIEAAWGTPSDLEAALRDVSFAANEKPQTVHERFAQAAAQHYARVGRLPPPNIQHMVLWAMASGPSTTSQIADYVHYELFMGKSKTPATPLPNT